LPGRRQQSAPLVEQVLDCRLDAVGRAIAIVIEQREIEGRDLGAVAVLAGCNQAPRDVGSVDV
jgi:hypothetical protein